MQSNPDELWDIYDENRCLTGRTHRRGDPLPHGDYHLVVQVWIRNSRGEYLLTKRAPTKGFPNMWECTGGSALSGDDSLRAALREVQEETGITLDPRRGICLMPIPREDNFCDVWLFQHDVDLSEVVLQPGETCDVMLASEEKIRELYREGTLVPFFYLDEFLKKARDIS
ncbi:MAG: NUDIX domain-containing protein [Clostridia bacterium]|nr:NUDIX domain-containing protein [Clostridia bacterium]